MCEGSTCICAPGYAGDDCALVAPCPQSCSERGLCMDGRCECAPGYGGRSGNCAVRVDFAPTRCPHDCAGRGVCTAGACVCVPGWAGVDCSVAAPCPQSCSSHGVCSRGQCFCAPGFSGEACEHASAASDTATKAEAARAALRRRVTLGAVAPIGRREGGHTCPSLCSSHGVCQRGVCQCAPGWSGDDCASRSGGGDGGVRSDAHIDASGSGVGNAGCQLLCSGHGTCERTALGTSRCVCAAGWNGANCDVAAPCPNGCSGFGVCAYGLCLCAAGSKGADCSAVATTPGVFSACPDDCSGVGVCREGGVCECLPVRCSDLSNPSCHPHASPASRSFDAQRNPGECLAAINALASTGFLRRELPSCRPVPARLLGPWRVPADA